MTSRIIVPFIASLALCATAALAQTPPPAAQGSGWNHDQMAGHWNKEDMEKHHAQMCTDHYAKAVGALAYLQTKLALSGVQKPLFEHWKSIKLGSIKARTADCGSMKMPHMDGDVVGAMKFEEKMLKTRLADLQAEMPAMEAMTASFSKEQNETLERAGMKLMHDRMEHMEGMMDHGHMGHGDMDHDGMGHDGPDAPPPPPAQ